MTKRVHVLTYGDLMLDVLVTGTCRRMSPEAAHAPVVSMGEVTATPGGAANVAANIASMGGYTTLIGAVGSDPCGAFLAGALQRAAKIKLELMQRERVPTTIKTRFFADRRQIMRLDFEQVAPLDEAEEDDMLARLLAHLPQAQVVMISDYAKGGVTPKVASRLIRAAANIEVPVVVDTKAPAAKHWMAAAVIKPNLVEIALALECEEPQTDGEALACAQTLRRRVGAAFVVLTRGARGLCLAGEPGGLHFPGHAVAAVDPTGAGDAVAASLALALAGGESIVEAARFANAAGAAAVSKMGTAALTFDEINFFYDCDARKPCPAGEGVAVERAPHRVH